MANPPQYIFFFCDLPSETGGETALIDSTSGVCDCSKYLYYVAASSILIHMCSHDTIGDKIPVYRYVADHHPEFMEKLKLHGGELCQVCIVKMIITTMPHLQSTDVPLFSEIQAYHAC